MWCSYLQDNNTLIETAKGDCSLLPLWCTWSTCSTWSTATTSVPPAQQGFGPVSAGPDEGHKDDQRAGVPFLRGRAERAEAVKPEEKTLGWPHYSFSILTEGL